MNKCSRFCLLAVAASPLVFADLASAAVPPVAIKGEAARSVCPTGATTRNKIFHFDKIVFLIGGGDVVAAQLEPIDSADRAKLNELPRNTELDIKVLDNPLAVADLKGKVLSFLGAQPRLESNRQQITIHDVEYTAVVCPKTQ